MKPETKQTVQGVLAMLVAVAFLWISVYGSFTVPKEAVLSGLVFLYSVPVFLLNSTEEIDTTSYVWLLLIAFTGFNFINYALYTIPLYDYISIVPATIIIGYSLLLIKRGITGQSEKSPTP